MEAVESKKKNNRGNNPQCGDEIAAEPIRDRRKVRDIATLLQDRPRELCLFLLGISTALRGSDLVSLNVGDVRGKSEIPPRREQKTGKKRMVTLNPDVQKAVARWLDVSGLPDDAPLFQGQRGRMTRATVSRLVKEWCGRVGLRGNYSSHTLRKTFGYHQRVTFGADIPTLMQIFNHRKQEQLLLYLCIQAEEVENLYLNSLL